MTSSTKPEVHNVLHCRQRRTEPRPQVTCTRNFMMFRCMVFATCQRTDRQTDRQTDRHTATLLQYFARYCVGDVKTRPDSCRRLFYVFFFFLPLRFENLLSALMQSHLSTSTERGKTKGGAKVWDICLGPEFVAAPLIEQRQIGLNSENCLQINADRHIWTRTRAQQLLTWATVWTQ